MSAVRAVSAFMVCSAAMLVVNKQTLRFFPLPLSVLWIQMAAATAVLALLYVRKRGSLRPWRDAVRWARLVPPLFVAMLSTGMLALRFASLGAVVVGRNAAPLISLPLESAVLRERPPASAWTWASLLGVLAGAIVYMHQDFGEGTSAAGVAFLVLNTVFATAERMAQRHLLAVRPVKLPQSTVLFINNGFGALLLSVLIPLVPLGPYDRPETHSWTAFEGMYLLCQAQLSVPEVVGAYVLLGLSCACGLAIGWTALRAQLHLSATSMLVVTNLNKVVVVAAGVVFFGETHTPSASLGMFVALAGGAAYGALQHADPATRGPEWRRAGWGALALSAALLVVVLQDVATRRAEPADSETPAERPARPHLDYLGWLEPTEAQVRAAPGGAGLGPLQHRDDAAFAHGPVAAEPQRLWGPTMWGALQRDPHDGAYHYLTRVNLLAATKHDALVGGGLYYAHYPEAVFAAHMADPALPWHGAGSGAARQRVVASACTHMGIPQDPRVYLLRGVLFAIANGGGGGGMWIAPLEALRHDRNCSSWVLLRAGQPAGNQKNWAPFEHDGALHLVYAWDPLIVVRCDEATGVCVRARTPGVDASVWPRVGPSYVHGGSELVPLDDGSWIGFVHARFACELSDQFTSMHNGMLAVLTHTEFYGFELRYVSPPLFPEGSSRNPDFFAFINEATGIVSANASADEMLITTNEMDSLNGLVRVRGAFAYARWGANWVRDWRTPLLAALRAECATWPAPAWAAGTAAAAWSAIGIALTAVLAAACVVAWLRAQGYVMVVAKPPEERIAIVSGAKPKPGDS